MQAPREHDISNVGFPAIAVCRGDSFVVHASASSLGGASPKALKSGYFERLYLYGSDGVRWPMAR